MNWDRSGREWGSRPGCLRGRLARDGFWGETPRRQAGRLPYYHAVYGEGFTIVNHICKTFPLIATARWERAAAPSRNVSSRRAVRVDAPRPTPEPCPGRGGAHRPELPAPARCQPRAPIARNWPENWP